MEDSRPFGVCLQGLASYRPRAALAKDRCRERRGRRHPQVVCQVGIEKASTSEPLFRRRQSVRRHQNRSPDVSPGQACRTPAYRVGGVRRKGGASSIRARLGQHRAGHHPIGTYRNLPADLGDTQLSVPGRISVSFQSPARSGWHSHAARLQFNANTAIPLSVCKEGWASLVIRKDHARSSAGIWLVGENELSQVT